MMQRKMIAAALALLMTSGAATANILSYADYENFYNFELKVRPIGDDLVALITKPPMPGGPSQAAIAAAVITQECMIMLIGNFEVFEAEFNNVGKLVGLAARMADSADELLVIRVLSNEAQLFLVHTKIYRQILGLTTARIGCSQDGPTVAKGQEIARIYNDADAVVGSIIKKIGAKPN